jgi:hypothetical protein
MHHRDSKPQVMRHRDSKQREMWQASGEEIDKMADSNEFESSSRPPSQQRRVWKSPVALGEGRGGGRHMWHASSPTVQVAKDENEYQVWHSLHTEAMQVAFLFSGSFR